MAVIGLDFDDTYTADPALWTRFVRDAVDRGHKVVMVTGRDDRPMHSDPSRHWGDEVRAALAAAGLTKTLPIVFAGENPKRTAAEKAGYEVDIWIDDHPEWVGGGR